jgi:exosortase A-associated hydrolase 1
LFWQAPPDGQALIGPLRKLNRLRSATQAGGEEQPPDSPVRPTLDAQTDTGATEPLAGYQLDARLLQGLDTLSCTPRGTVEGNVARHALFLNTQRLVRDGQSPPAPLMQRVEQWQLAGWQVQASLAAGEPFWSSMEPSTPIACFDQTQAWLRSLPAVDGNAAQPSAGLVEGRLPWVIAEAQVSKGVTERPVLMLGEQGPMIGVLSLPAAAAKRDGAQPAALIVPGQPQTRVGAHRMFVELARSLAAHGIVTLRLDIGGWGDSPGSPRAFESSASDIAIAARTLAHAAAGPSQRAVSLWVGGLCDGASAAMLALPAIESAGLSPAGVYLLNPWVRSDASLGDAMIRNYYAKRVLDPELWRRLFTGKIGLKNLLLDPIRHLSAKLLAGRGRHPAPEADPSRTSGNALPAASNAGDLPSTFISCRETFKGRVATVLSGADLTAAESESLISANPRWKRGLQGKGAEILRIPDADHTLTRPDHWTLATTWLAKQIRA